MDANKVTSMDKIEYWFDKKKIGNTDTKPVKEKFKEMIYNGTTLTTKGEAVFNAIWGNAGLREKLFEKRAEPIAKLYFTNTIVTDITNVFYDFIQIK